MALQKDIDEKSDKKNGKDQKPEDKIAPEKKAEDFAFKDLNLLQNESALYKDWRVIAFFLGAVVFVLLSRLIRLGFKPPMHDETMFFFYSFEFSKHGGYNYMPILHGPFMMFMSALYYVVLGASDFVLRLPVAVVAMSIFAFLWGMRRHFGLVATIFVFTFFAMSPTIMYYSRFWRSDIPLEFSFIASLFCFLRLVETGKGKFLLWAILFWAIAFSTMENSIFFFFTTFVFFFIYFFTNFISNILEDKKAKKPYFKISDLLEPRIIYISAAIVIAVGLMKLYLFHKIFEGLLLKDFIVLDFIKFASPFKYYALSFLGFAVSTAVLIPIVYSIIHKFGRNQEMSRLSNIFALNWIYLISGLLAGFMLYFILFTTFLTNTDPAMSGPLKIYHETFAYWWGQHQEHRIRGDYHYYMPIMLIYEFLPMFIVIAGTIYSLCKNKKLLVFVLPAFAFFLMILMVYFGAMSEDASKALFAKWDKMFKIQYPIHVYMIFTIGFFGILQTIRHLYRKETLFAFVFFWFWLSLLLYSYAGEKVPWLVAHISVPMFFTAGLYMKKLLASDFYKRGKFIIAPLFIFLLLFTFTTSMKLCFYHPWSVKERLVYGHTTMEVKKAAEEILRVTQLIDTRYDTVINIESGLLINWPMRWYLRDYKNVREVGGVETWENPICIVKWENVAPDAKENIKYKNILDNYYVTKVEMLQWWQPPMPDIDLLMDIRYAFSPNPKESFDQAKDIKLKNAKAEWRKIYRYILHRETFDALNAQWPTVSGQASALCIRKDIYDRK